MNNVSSHRLAAPELYAGQESICPKKQSRSTRRSSDSGEVHAASGTTSDTLRVSEAIKSKPQARSTSFAPCSDHLLHTVSGCSRRVILRTTCFML